MHIVLADVGRESDGSGGRGEEGAEVGSLVREVVVPESSHGGIAVSLGNPEAVELVGEVKELKGNSKLVELLTRSIPPATEPPAAGRKADWSSSRQKTADRIGWCWSR